MKTKKQLLLLVICLVVIIAGLIMTYLVLRPHGRQGSYAVFLTDGQVYFGNILDEKDKTLLLKNVYYLQLKDLQGNTLQSPVLVKLGNELHAPEDWIEINKQQINFIEKLKNDGKVAQAIANGGK